MGEDVIKRLLVGRWLNALRLNTRILLLVGLPLVATALITTLVVHWSTRRSVEDAIGDQMVMQTRIAGHEPALLVDPASGFITDLKRDGLFLGIDVDLTFREHRTPFHEPGQVVARYTDGITEAWNENDEQFGRERLKQSLLRHVSQPVTAMLDGVLHDVFDFRGMAPQKDDPTLVMLKRTP